MRRPTGAMRAAGQESIIPNGSWRLARAARNGVIVNEEFAAPEVIDDDHVRGPHDAPVTVIEYGDYECPFCRGAARYLPLLRRSHPGMIRLVFRNFPIRQLHPHAEWAAQAAEAAAAQGKFWEMHELLLQPACRLDLDTLCGDAERLGLDTDRFVREVMDAAYTARIERDLREGVRNGVNSTPKFYVNGRRIDGHLPLEGLREAVYAGLPGGVAAS